MTRIASIVAATVLGAPAGVAVIKLPGYSYGPPWTGAVVSAQGSIWASSHVGEGIYRIDPQRNRVVGFINVGGNQCLSIAAGLGKLWVGNCWGETGRAVVSEINVASGRVVHLYNGASPLFGDGSLWLKTQDSKTILRIDPRSRLVIARIAIPTGPVGRRGFAPVLTADCDGSVWLNADTSVIRVDPATNKVVSLIPLPGAISDADVTGGWLSSDAAGCAAGKLWLLNAAGVYSVDEASNTATRRPIAVTPNSQLGDAGLVARGSEVFARTSDNTVTEIDATSGTVVHRYPAGGGGGGQIAVADGSLWIPAATAGAVWRVPLASP